MKWHRIHAVFLRHLYETRHNLDRVADMIYWPALDVLMWGFFTVYLSRDNRLHPGVTTFLLGAIILWGLFRGFQRDMAVGFLAEFWSRNLANLFASPLTLREYMTGLILLNLLKALLGLSVAAAVAWLCYAYRFVRWVPLLLPYLLDLILFALVIGLITTALIFRYSTRIQALAYGIAGLLMPFSCVFYPVTSLPIYLHPFAWALPTTHAFEGMRQVMAGNGFSAPHFGSALALNVAYCVAAILLFDRLFKSARSRGLLVKGE